MGEALNQEVKDPRFVAAIKMIERTGSKEFQLRYSDDEQPVVWMAVAVYPGKGAQAAAALNPVDAVFRLCDQLIDGGMCLHCHRPTGFSEDFDPMPLQEEVCWYQWDPEREVFRRDCE